MAKKAEKKPSGALLTRPQMAAEFGVFVGTITRWERDGMPVAQRASRGRHSLFDLKACKAWREKAHAAGGDRGATHSLTTAKAIESERRTEKLELEIAVKRGDLVHRDQVLREGHAFGRALAAKIRSLPRRAEHAGVIERSQLPGLEGLCRDILEEISKSKTFGAPKVAKE
jgi:phage terminase Nu1 subunit (DNA packaging protein)